MFFSLFKKSGRTEQGPKGSQERKSMGPQRMLSVALQPEFREIGAGFEVAGSRGRCLELLDGAPGQAEPPLLRGYTTSDSRPGGPNL